jgi:hypothetical protein
MRWSDPSEQESRGRRGRDGSGASLRRIDEARAGGCAKRRGSEGIKQVFPAIFTDAAPCAIIRSFVRHHPRMRGLKQKRLDLLGVAAIAPQFSCYQTGDGADRQGSGRAPGG